MANGSRTIPKGEVEPGAVLLATAQREFTEETNLVAAGDFTPLTPVKLKSGKLVYAFAFEADFDLSGFAPGPTLPAIHQETLSASR